MSEKKDFLGSLADEVNKKPASFQEEKIERIEKKPVSPKTLMAAFAALAVVAVGAYVIFFMPKIILPDFEGKSMTELSQWVKQYGIEPTGIVATRQYDFDHEENIIISQSLPAGSKVRKDVKLNVVVSSGADPDELVRFPDLMNMTYSEINTWIKNNKLTNTRISTNYDNEVEEDRVISYELKNVEEKDFTRSTALSINVSKGPKPLATYTLDNDYVNQPIDYLRSWASGKNITVETKESYSNSVPQGCIISMNYAKGEKIKEGDTILATISKGSVIKLIDFTGKTDREVRAWFNDRGGIEGSTFVLIPEANTYEKGKVFWQDISGGTVLKDYDTVKIYVSSGIPNVPDYVGAPLESLKDWIDGVNTHSFQFNLTVKQPGVLSEEIPVGHIYELTQNGANITVTLSRGRNLWLQDQYDPDSGNTLRFADILSYTEDEARSLLRQNGLTVKVSYAKDENVDTHHVISVKRSDNVELKANSYCPEDVTILLVICDK